jgi:Lrp/AsnC family leucine-responsive transcriptional regulator
MLDERDRRILAELQRDGRATYAEIAAQVGLSSSAVHDRVRKLEASGAIRGYHAELDPVALGLGVTALVAITPIDPSAPDDIPERVADLAEIEDCHSVAGDANYVLKVRVGSTLELEDFLRRIREQAGVFTRTTIALSTPYEHRPLRLD